jgi:DNA polymerase-3 subunit chi
MDGYSRIVVMFDGNDETALAEARKAWQAARTGGHEATYWQQSDRGRWEKRAG